MTNNFNLEKFNEAVLKGEATWWQMDLPSGDVIFGEQKATLLGYPEDNFKTYHQFTELLHPDDLEKTMQIMRDHLEGKLPAYETTYRIKRIDGFYLFYFDYGMVTKRDGDNITIIGFVMKVEDPEKFEEDAKEFKEMIHSGEISLFDLFTKAKEGSL